MRKANFSPTTDKTSHREYQIQKPIAQRKDKGAEGMR